MENLAKMAAEAAQNDICIDSEKELFAFLRYKAKCKSEKSGCKFPVSDMEIDINAYQEWGNSIEFSLRDKGCESTVNSTREHYMERVQGLTHQGEVVECIKVNKFGKNKFQVCTWEYTI